MEPIYSLLRKCTSLSRIKQLQSHLIITGSFNYFPRSKLLDFCATSPAGDLSYATYIFRQLPSPAINEWNAIIRGLAITPQPTNAITWFVSMSPLCKPDALTCSFVLKACARALAVFEGREVQSQVLRYGFVFDVLLQTTLLDVYAKSGDLDSARKVFDEMSVRDVTCWNVLIYGLAQGSRPSDALEMPMVPDLVLWQTLLGASKTYGNVEMAEKASRKLEEMGSSSCGDFVLLSNVYAAQERWKDVGRVREAMKSRDVKKIPGFSYIEAGGVMHKFVNGDRRHLFQDQIYRKLDEISFRIKEHGYMAETSYVLHDIGEGEKENALWHHSEKLAVAYGSKT
ncbi:Pentatricopeptide repeat-containing protein [Heracleum sosnowskyi]|uniref:Pentatricopeptide repeat-containing protein n=1 Tax=Heracleum sosnowskyi TaxID=360622 RepID=A0AAD8GW12_9APIA|nr:Pentatricopeptide repeat-containing protein [Heracleum sosnowskyi]